MVSESNNLDCTIIIVSYNSQPVTDICLAKAEQAVNYCQTTLKNKVTIVVVDNGSADGSATMIRQKHPAVKLMALEKNIGYSKANNLAMKEAKTAYILLLNSDAYLEADTLVKAINYMQKNQKADGLGVKQIFPDGSFQASGGYLPTPLKTILWALGLESLPIIKNLIQPIYQFNPNYYTKERQVEWTTTAFLMIKGAVYEKTGGFDERIFLYTEDLEWCQRMKELGLKIFYSPDISIIHLGGFSSKKLPSAKLLKHHSDGMLHFHRVHFPKAAGLVIWFIRLGFNLRAIFYTLAQKPNLAAPYKEAILAHSSG